MGAVGVERAVLAPPEPSTDRALHGDVCRCGYYNYCQCTSGVVTDGGSRSTGDSDPDVETAINALGYLREDRPE